MISLQEFKVSADGKYLIVDVMVDPSLSGVYISTLKISQTGIFNESDTQPFDLLISDATNHYTGETLDWDSHPTKIWLVLDVDSISDAPFFLEVMAADPEHSATTCAYKNTIDAATFNKYPLYKAIACAAHSFDGCEPPAEFFDFLMRLKALEASVQTHSWNDVIDYYKWLIQHVNLGYKCMGEAPVSPHMPHHHPFGPVPPHYPSPHPPFPPHHHGCGCRH